METQKQMKWISDKAHSEIEFSARHMMISTVKGNFGSFEITAFGSDKTPESTKVIVTIDPSSISTRDNDRDNHLKSPDFFDAEKYKEIKFESTSISKKGESEYIIKGNLTIRDVTKEITFHGDLEGIIKDPYGKTRAGITVSGEIVREEFGLKWNMVIEAGKVMVGSKIKFTAHAEMILQE